MRALGPGAHHHPGRRHDQEQSWPTFAPQAAALGAGSMPAFQLFITDDTLGALNPHSSRPNAFDDTSISVGGTVATHATIAVIAAQREEQFRAAMTSRDIISHTKGILMEHFSVDADRAFGPLRALSQRLQRTARRNHSASLPKPNIRPSPDTLRNRRLPRRDTPRAQGSACR